MGNSFSSSGSDSDKGPLFPISKPERKDFGDKSPRETGLKTIYCCHHYNNQSTWK